MTETLPAFLLARFAEDEAEARSVADPISGRDDLWTLAGPFDPARVLAEVKAKRRIVETSVDMDALPDGERVDQRVTLRWVCQGLALPYADHPDYRQEWRP